MSRERLDFATETNATTLTDAVAQQIASLPPEARRALLPVAEERW